MRQFYHSSRNCCQEFDNVCQGLYSPVVSDMLLLLCQPELTRAEGLTSNANEMKAFPKFPRHLWRRKVSKDWGNRKKGVAMFAHRPRNPRSDVASSDVLTRRRRYSDRGRRRGRRRGPQEESRESWPTLAQDQVDGSAEPVLWIGKCRQRWVRNLRRNWPTTSPRK